MASSFPKFSFRAPSHTGIPAKEPASSYVPPTKFMRGKWTVTHSTLPMWRKAQNVSITYTPMSNSSSREYNPVTWDNLVEYQSLGAVKDAVYKTVKGIESPRAGLEGAWRWRGKGWLMIASSDWEVLGYGSFREDVLNVGKGSREEEEERVAGADWVVTYFAKTLFTPAGIDILCRRRSGDESVAEGVKQALVETGSEEVRKLVEELFEVERTK